MLVCVCVSEGNVFLRSGTYNLLHDLARGVEVDQTLVNLELKTIPGLGTFTTWLFEGRCKARIMRG